jgi:hypothetical protein
MPSAFGAGLIGNAVDCPMANPAPAVRAAIEPSRPFRMDRSCLHESARGAFDTRSPLVCFETSAHPRLPLASLSALPAMRGDRSRRARTTPPIHRLNSFGI